jgi:hypothetical protein
MRKDIKFIVPYSAHCLFRNFVRFSTRKNESGKLGVSSVGSLRALPVTLRAIARATVYSGLAALRAMP